MEHKIYCLKDPRTNQIRYIGKTTKELHKRLLHGHLCDKTKTHKTNWINSLKKEGLLPIIELIKSCKNESRCNYAESFYIKLFGRADLDLGILVNSTNGGEGTIGRVLSEETKNKIGSSNKGKNLGVKWSEERKQKHKITYQNIPEEKKKKTIEKIVSANKGRRHSAESRLKMSKSQREREAPSQKTKNKISNTLLGFKNKNTSSKYIGVSFIASQNLYRATIRFNQDSIIISHFKNEVHAAVAYNKKAVELYGTKAKINNIPNWENIDISKKRTSRFFGVSFKKKPQKWETSLYNDKKHKYIGSYNSELEAAKAYNEYLIKNNINKPLNQI